ncbi:hypothetical protein ABZ471_25250 [Streptomyces sp. NPDC005728]|uniref:hypothetical protein n=1 Tax=Streptomyces sp. NPDC005728 TaxID=3157054 RepID=UPI0033FAE4E1
MLKESEPAEGTAAGMLTADEAARVEQLRARLGLVAGAAESKYLRGLRRGDKTGVLIGAAYHAADRHRQGQSLTELEQGLVGVLRTMMSQAEMHAAGQVYREAVATLGRLQTVPQWVTELPVSQGIHAEDFMAHLPEVGAEAHTMPNVSLASVDALAAGEPVDSKTFVEAVSEVGFGATVYDTAPPAPGQPTQHGVFRAEVELDKFCVRRVVGDGLSGRNDVYWTVASSSDRQGGSPFKSQEFDAVEHGQTRTFAQDPAHRLVFNGDADQHLLFSITTWEADHSNSRCYDALFRGLQQAIEVLESMPSFGFPMNYLPNWVGAAYETVKFFTEFHEHFRRHDDQSCTRVIALTRSAITTLYHRGTDTWEFNGDGWHSLTINYTGERPPTLTGAVEYTVFSGTDVDTKDLDEANDWTEPVPLGWLSNTPAALASHAGALHAMFTRPDNDAVLYSVCRNGTWSTPVHVRDWVTKSQSAITVFNGTLVSSHIGTDQSIYVSRLVNGTWEPTRSPVPKAVHGLSMACAHDRLYLGFVPLNPAWEDCPCTVSADANFRWTFLHGPILGEGIPDSKTNHPVSLANYNGALAAAFTHTGWEDRVWVGQRPTKDPEYDTIEHNDGAAAGHGPTLVTGPGPDKLFVLGRSRQNQRRPLIRQRHLEGSTWRQVGRITVPGILEGEFSGVWHDGKLLVMYRHP